MVGGYCGFALVSGLLLKSERFGANCLYLWAVSVEWEIALVTEEWLCM